ncbi:MAG: helix-turn-helix domain-containing protein [Abitibacteriaceae bacterium]|nr:helix-turn-helix domain-containing protein [Abditibacteriaceae bacterium]
MEKQTDIVLAQELFEQGLSKSAIARRLGRDRETIRLWLRGLEQHGQQVRPAKWCRWLTSTLGVSLPLSPLTSTAALFLLVFAPALKDHSVKLPFQPLPHRLDT